MASKETPTVPEPHSEPTSCSSSESNISISKPVLQEGEDGGLQGWLTIAGAFCAMFVQFGLNNAFGVFQAYYKEHQLKEYSSDTIGWIGGIQQFLFLIGGLFTGRMLDAYGPHSCIVPGSILLVLSLMITSVCEKYYQFMLGQSVLFGAGAALIFSPVMAIPSQWFPNRRAMATSIAICGSGLGGTLWPIMLQRMIAQIGFGWAMRTAGFISLALLGVACALIRPRYPPRKATPFTSTFTCFKDPNWLLMSFGTVFSTMGCFMPSFYITLRAQQLGADPALAFYILSIMNASSTIGRLGASLGDWTGRFNLNIISTACNGLLLLAFWIPLNSVNALIGFAVAYGPFLGLVFSLNAPCLAQISEPHEVGSRVGMMFALNAPFNMVAIPIAGAFVAKFVGQDGFRYAGAFAGSCCLIGAMLIFAAKLRINTKLLAKV